MSKQIDDLVKSRRKELGLPENHQDKWGLALSGGGIRSATFCFGLLSALSRNQLLRRFDLLSTVSGGGYIGAMLGRLLCRASSADEVRQILDAFGSSKDSWFRMWLRANGRYLVPRGAADKLFALTIFLRNLLAIHLELGAIALLLGVILVAVNVLAWSELASLANQESALFPYLRWLSPWLPTLWVVGLPVIIILGGFAASAYWVVPWVAKNARPGLMPGRAFVRWCALLVFVIVIVFGLIIAQPPTIVIGEVGQEGRALRQTIAIFALMITVFWMVAIPWAWWRLHHCASSAAGSGTSRTREEEVRRGLTDWQVACVKLAGVILIAGLVDRAAWFLAFDYQDLANAGIALAVGAALLRAGLPVLSGLQPQILSSRSQLLLIQLAGYFLTFLLVTWWVSLTYRAAMLGTMFGGTTGVDFSAASMPLTLIGLSAIVYIHLTKGNFQFLNLSSLHTFYRARLVRAYLGAGNPHRFDETAQLHAVTEVSTPLPTTMTTAGVFKPDPEDDLDMASYAPHKYGGPVHLIGVCINQTRDPRGGLINQDRRGQPLTVGPQGLVRVDQADWQTIQSPGALSLGAWIAISGAAVAPGLGNNTRGGISALLTYAGIRLGYWWEGSVHGLSDPKALETTKSDGLLSEVFCNFKGAAGPNWFLTDGGHFENTAAYALLAERCKWIVLADCGADPHYRFGDIENLVRKARIDFGAEIHFLRPRASALSSPIRPAALAHFGSLNELASERSNACLAMAQVIYRGDSEPGWIVLVKPNLSSSIPMDLVHFATSNPEFPQQATADQFFDEAQWESYYLLGLTLGSALTEAFIIEFRKDPDKLFERDQGTFAATTESSTAASAADHVEIAGQAAKRRPPRLPTGAIATSISVGAVATVLLSFWQGLNQMFETQNSRRDQEHLLVEELTEHWTKLTVDCPANSPTAPKEEEPERLAELAGTFLRFAATLCPAGKADWIDRMPFVWSIYEDVLYRCQNDTSVACHTLITTARKPDTVRTVLGPMPNCFLNRHALQPNSKRRPVYWAYEYRESMADSWRNHPSDPKAKLRKEDTEDAQDDQSKRRDSICGVSRAVNVATKDSTSQDEEEKFTQDNTDPGASDTLTPTTCRNQTIFMQIHGPDSRDTVRNFREAWRAIGANVPPIEDVVASARAAGRTTPQSVSRTIVRYHDAVSLKCAESLAKAVKREDQAWYVEALSARFRATPGVIEVWFPRDFK